MSTDLTLAYRRFFPLLVRKCSRMLRDPHAAEDVAQESFLRLARSGLLLTDDRAVTAWLYKTSTRLAIDRLRRRAPAVDTSLELLVSAPVQHEESLARRMLAILRVRTPDDELAAAVLFHVDGLTQAEVADVLGVSERSVRRWLASFGERTARLRAWSER